MIEELAGTVVDSDDGALAKGDEDVIEGLAGTGVDFETDVLVGIIEEVDVGVFRALISAEAG